MVVLFGIIINSEKTILKGLVKISGISFFQAEVICSKLGLDPFMKFADLFVDDTRSEDAIMDELMNLIKGLYGPFLNVKSEEKFNIRKLKRIKHYKGYRHSLSMPVRGQRTRTNGGTQWRIGNRFKNL